MNKQKLKYVPFNFFWCISSFFIPFFILMEVADFRIFESSIISIYVYLLDVMKQTDMDYLNERIKNLEEKK